MNIYGKVCRNCGKNLLLKNRYRVIKLLGRGGFAKTFEIDDAGTTKVLKVLELSRFSDSKKNQVVVNLFQREVEVLSRLNHPGIPKVDIDGYFQLEFLDNNQILHCLVMEKIDGLNLQQWLINRNNQPITPEQALIWLKQLVEILQQVHQKNYFHRDIKPANIMLRSPLAPLGKGGWGDLVLIDFGAVKDLAETFLQQEDTVVGDTLIGSRGYAAPEQLQGKTVTQSDFFALGRTFVHLLTGIHPVELEDARTCKLMWRDKVPSMSISKFDLIHQLRWRPLSNLLDEMMATSWEKRPPNTQAILQRLNQKFPLPRFFGYAASAAIFFVITLFGSYWYVTGINGCTKIWIRNFPTGDDMICGEEVLLNTSTILEKQEGVNAFAGGNYQLAINLLEKAWQEQRDPETLIYLNNYRLQLESFQVYTIAVAAPISDNNNDSINSSKEILRGVAQAQQEFNQKHKDKKIGLKVLIVSDHNKKTHAQNIAKYLGTKPDVLAVIGHFRSDTTLAAIKAYQHQQLLLISPTSTSEELSTVCKSAYPNCFFALFLVIVRLPRVWLTI
jgi:serine/threonine protein kinase